MRYAKPVKIDALKGRTFASVSKTDTTVTFDGGSAGPSFRLKHMQDCCESVWLEDVAGDLADLAGSPIVMAEESTETGETGGEHSTWTFYKLGTAKGYVTLRWCGTSNGYYGEEVDLFELEGERA